MSKIVQVANAIISNRQLISNVIPRGKEFFFLYGGKYKWSISNRPDDVYFLFFYPGRQKLDQLASFDEQEWQDFEEMVSYNSKDIGTREAYETFSELYAVVKGKIFNVDDAFDEILEMSKAPF